MGNGVPFDVEVQDIQITDRAGFALLGAIADRVGLAEALDGVRLEARPRPMIRNADVVLSILAQIFEGHMCFDRLERRRNDLFFREALGLKTTPSSATARQRCEQGAEAFAAVLAEKSREMLAAYNAPVTPVQTSEGPRVCLDIDLMAQNNDGTKKEGVRRTYRGFDGYGIVAAYLGAEGWMVHERLQEGHHHANWNAGPFLRDAIDHAQALAPGRRLLVRMDSGCDAQTNVDLCREKKVDWLIKRNFRRQDTGRLIRRIRREGRLVKEDGWERVYVWSEWRQTGDGRERFVYRLTEVLGDRKKGRRFLWPQPELDGWRTSLTVAEEEVVELYEDHGTSEQFHSEYKSDLDMERLPSGRLAVNALLLAAAAFAYNAARLIGQKSLELEAKRPTDRPSRRPVRRRLRTVIHDFVHLGARLVRHARRWKLVLSRSAWQATVWMRLYAWLWRGPQRRMAIPA